MTEYLVGRNLSFRYGKRAVIQAASLAAAPGRATVLVGPSGSGKTTLLWLLAGLLRPAGGSTGLADSPDAQGTPPRRIDHRKDRIGMVFQHQALWDHLTAQKHLELVLAGKAGSARRGRSDRRERIDRALGQMRLGHLRAHRPAELSGGERQRLGIARALVVRPAWLFLDEPLAHLDGPARGEVFDLLLAALAEAGAGVLMATHSAAEAMSLADEIVILLDGRIAQAGPPEQLYRHPVSLAAARALGPAAELSGEARGGVLTRDGQTVLEGLDGSQSGPARLIVRPEDVEFVPASDSPAAGVIRRCEFAGGVYLLHVEAGGERLIVRHGERLAPGQPGRLRLLRRERR